MRFCRAHSLDEALEWLSEWGEDGRLLAGGTDLMLQYRLGEVTPGALISIEGIKALSSITADVRTGIGALATHSTLAADAGIASHHPALTMAARLVGGWQTQATGTVGGQHLQCLTRGRLVAAAADRGCSCYFGLKERRTAAAARRILPRPPYNRPPA